jgi:hypothetical protein
MLLMYLYMFFTKTFSSGSNFAFALDLTYSTVQCTFFLKKNLPWLSVLYSSERVLVIISEPFYPECSPPDEAVRLLAASLISKWHIVPDCSGLSL